MKQFRVVGLIEHAHKPNAPRVATFFAGLIDQDWHAPVDCLRQLSVTPRPEDGTGTRVRIQESNVFVRERNVPLLVVQVAHAVCEENEVSLTCVCAGATEQKHAKLETAVNVGEDPQSILEIVQRDECL